MTGTWKCPSLCDEALIQTPVVHDDIETIDGVVLRTSHCPICGKQMSFHVNCTHSRRAGFIVVKNDLLQD